MSISTFNPFPARLYRPVGKSPEDVTVAARRDAGETPAARAAGAMVTFGNFDSSLIYEPSARKFYWEARKFRMNPVQQGITNVIATGAYASALSWSGWELRQPVPA
jgi:hypothetical protein